MPLNTSFTGHTGVVDDVDCFAFTVPEVGTVTVSIDIAEPFNALTIDKAGVAAYADVGPESITGTTSTTITSNSCTDDGITTRCQTVATFRQSVTPVQGTYVLRVTASGDHVHEPGFDSQHPYTLRVDFTPGSTLESQQPDVDGQYVGEADTWRSAYPVAFSQGAYGQAKVSTYAYYKGDVDWVTFHAESDGWVRLVADIRQAEDNDPSQTALDITAVLYDKSASGMEETGIALSVADVPKCVVDRDEYREVKAGHDYYLRVSPTQWLDTLPYNLLLEYGADGPEDDQPGVVGAVDTPQTAYYVGTVTLDGPAVVAPPSYLWHYGDCDWYKVHTPPGIGSPPTLVGIADYSQSYDALGWNDYDLMCSMAPDGIHVLTAFYDHTATDLCTSTVPIADGPPRGIVYCGGFDEDFYLSVCSLANWDQTNPYTVSFVYTSNY